MLALSAVLPAAPSAFAGTPGGGFELLDRQLIGETPVPQVIYLDPQAARAGSLRRLLVADAAELRSIGFNISFGGYGDPGVAEGRIQVVTAESGCRLDGSPVSAITYPHWSLLPNGDAYMHDAQIVLCPQLFTGFPAWERAPLLRHELGHALGLAHMNGTFRGRYQIMHWQVTPQITDYQAGDLNGLRWLAGNAGRVRAELPPEGVLEQVTRWPSGAATKVVMTGWVLLQSYPARAVKLVVTRDAVPVFVSYSAVTGTYAKHGRESAAQHSFRIAIGTPDQRRHTYCVSAVSPVDHRAAVSLGCVTVGGPAVPAGLRGVSAKHPHLR